jgi:hypothetical protein
VPCFLALLKTKGFIEPKGSKRDFEGLRNRLMGGRRNGRRYGWAEGWEYVWFGTTNKPPGRRNTMILGILNMHLCLCMFLHYT